jgi:hypothetical protein
VAALLIDRVAPTTVSEVLIVPAMLLVPAC